MCEYYVQAEKGVQKYAFSAASEDNGRQHVHVSIFLCRIQINILSQNRSRVYATCTSMPFLDYCFSNFIAPTFFLEGSMRHCARHNPCP
jgi:hypothetical protein